PLEFAEDWDNVGLLLGNKDSQVERILVTLDVTGGVVDEAVRKDVDMIIAHHPIIFSPVKSIGQNLEDKNILYPLIKNEIAVYCAHTNFDKAKGGVDDTLAAIIEAKDPKVLVEDDESGVGLGRVGSLNSSMTVAEYAKQIGKALMVEDLCVIGDSKREVKRTVSCAGAGGSFIRQAAEAGADVFITGEIKYHDALLALELNLPVISLGHYETELPAMGKLIRRLQNKFNALQYKVEVLSSKTQYNI